MMNNFEISPLLLQIATSIAEGMSIHDKNGKFIEVNQRLCEIFEYTREELLARGMKDVVDSASMPGKAELDNRIANKSNDREIIGIGNNGKRLHLLITTFPMPSLDNKFQGTISVWADISLKVERDKGAQLLKELEDIVAWISVQFINMPYPLIDQGLMWLLGDLGTVLKADRALVFSLTDMPELLHEWQAKHMQPPVGRSNIILDKSLINKIKAKERVAMDLSSEKRLEKDNLKEQEVLKKSGLKALACIPIMFQDEVTGMLWFESSHATFSWNQGIFDQLQLVSILIANALDRKNTGTALRTSEEKYKTLAETAQDFIIVYNTSAKILYVNKAAIVTSEYSEEELYKKSVWDFVSPRDLDQARKDLATIISAPSGETLLSELDLVTKSGRKIPVEINSSLLARGGPGNEIEILAHCRDVSKRRELDKMRHDFVIMASHELKTPMVSILGSSDFLAQHFKEEMSERAYQLVQLIRRGSYRLRNLILELIDVSRIETDKFVLHVEPHDLVKIARESIQNMSYLLNECNHEIQTVFPDQLLIPVDSLRIDQVFTNLISNAAKNSPSGSRSIVKIEHDLEQVIVSVKDNGVGLTTEEQSKLFEKFSKIDRPNMNINIQGSGLGLFITRQIVESHGGKIWVESEGRNKGSTFTFTLPVKKE
jgi:PAS domain S-box-containing protein